MSIQDFAGDSKGVSFFYLRKLLSLLSYLKINFYYLLYIISTLHIFCSFIKFLNQANSTFCGFRVFGRSIYGKKDLCNTNS